MANSPQQPSLLTQSLLVAAGGALGALARYGLTQLFSSQSSPSAPIVANLSGAFALGLLTAAFASSARCPTWLKAGALTGFLGSFTTTSTFASELVLLTLADAPAIHALIYGLISLAGGLALATLGLKIGANLSDQRGALS